MKFDPELEEILNSIKSREENDGTPTEPAASSSLPEKEYVQELEPPKVPVYEQVKDTVEPKEEELVWVNFGGEGDTKEIAPKKKKPKKEKAPKREKKKPSKRVSKKTLAVIASVLLILAAAVVFAKPAYKAINEAYISHCCEKYGVVIPDDIKHKYIKIYGNDPTFAGELSIDDNATDVKVYGSAHDGCALLEKGSTVLEKQHFRAIAVSKEYCDLERIYSTPEGYINSTQKITFQTLTDKEVYQVYAAYYTNTAPEDDEGYVYPYNLWGNMTEKSFKQFRDRTKTHSLYFTGYRLKYDDYVLTVSQDTDFMPGYRFVVVAYKIDGKLSKLSENVKNNPIIDYPANWYEKNRINDPYIFLNDWYPEIYTSDGKTVQLKSEDF